MIRARRLSRALASDQRGSTLVEFALILAPMLMILIGGLDVGYQSYARTVMQGALNDAARRASVENPVLHGEGETMEEQIADGIRQVAGKLAADATITVTQRSFFDFSTIGSPEKLMTDHNDNGEFDEADGDCWQDYNGNGSFDTDGGSDGRGGADDVAFYRAEITMPRLFPIDAFIPSLGDEISIEVETAMRNQPYDEQAEPVVLCGGTG